jgi:hypothetical protein
MSVEILIAVPQAKELEPLLAAFTAAAGYRPRRATFPRLEGYLLEEFRLLFAVGGHGKTQFAVQTQHLIEAECGLGGCDLYRSGRQPGWGASTWRCHRRHVDDRA